MIIYVPLFIVWTKTADALGTPLNVLNPGETFGPSKW